MNKKEATLEEMIVKSTESLGLGIKLNLRFFGETILHLCLGKYYASRSNITVRGKYKITTAVLAKEFGHLSTNELSNLLSFGRCKLTFDFKIDRNFNDHKTNLDETGFVLDWTLQREETLP